MAILRAEADFDVVASCQDGAKCIQTIRELSPDLALIDISLPCFDGLKILAVAKLERISTRIVYLSEVAEPAEGERAIARGAYGVISKEAAPQLLLRGLRRVMFGKRLLPALGFGRQNGHASRGGHEDLAAILTEREREIMRLVRAGLSNKEVGRQLNLTDGTIKVHLHHIYQKLAVHNRTALAALATSADARSREEVANGG
jgi:DNA-binding NarL/FixJ family response regulator